MVKLAIVLLTFVSVLGARAETWSSIEGEHFIVMFTGSEGAARNIQEIAEDFYPKVTGDLGYSTNREDNYLVLRIPEGVQPIRQRAHTGLGRGSRLSSACPGRYP